MRTPRGAAASVLIAALVLGSGACGGSGEDDGQEAPAGSPLAEPAATEASPEAPAAGPESTDLGDADRELVEAAVRAYVAALNDHDGAAACALLAPGAIDQVRLPVERGDCARSLGDSTGYRGPGGTPVWKRTTVQELTAVSVGEDTARVTATVTHQFADRNYPSVEEDVIYLERSGDEWLIAKPSASLYRAVGYPEPPLRSLTPP